MCCAKKTLPNQYTSTNRHCEERSNLYTGQSRTFLFVGTRKSAYSSPQSFCSGTSMVQSASWRIVPCNDERREAQFYFEANSFAIDLALSANRINSDR